MTLNYGLGAQVATVVGERNRIMNDPNQFVLDKVEDLAEINRGLYAPPPGSGAMGSLVRRAMGAALGVGIARGIGSVLGLGSTFQNKLETAAMGIGLLKAGDDQSIDQDEARQAFRVAFVKAAYDAGYFHKDAAVLVEKADLQMPPALAFNKALARAQAAGLKPEQSTFDEIHKQYKAHGGKSDGLTTGDYAPLIGATAGEALGAATGAMVGGEGNRLVPGLVGASIGGAAGLGAGFLLKHILGKKRQKKVGSIGFSAVSVSPGMLLAVPQAASNALMLGSRATGAAAGALDAPSADDEHEAQLEATRDLLRQRLAQAKALKAETTLRQLLAKRKR